MIEAYSNNIAVSENSLVPFNTVFQKGSTVEKSGDSALKFNKCGIYILSLNATGVASTGGNITLQLMVNGVLQSNALASVTATDTSSTHNLTFSTKIQVPSNASNCACSPEFVVSVVNNGVTATYSLVDVLVTKLV